MESNPAGPARRRRSDEFRARLAAHYATGASLAEVGARAGITATTVLYHLRKAGVRIRRPGRQPAGRQSAAVLLWAADELDARAASRNEQIHDYTDHLRAFTTQPHRPSLVPWPPTLARPSNLTEGPR